MRHWIRAAFLVTTGLTASVLAQPGPRNLGFEEGRVGASPDGWSLTVESRGYAAQLTTDHPKSGTYSVEISPTSDSNPARFANLMQSFPALPYRGKRVRFRAAVRVAAAAPLIDRAQLWFRTDRPGQFESVKGPIRDPQWRDYEILAEIAPDATRIDIGITLFGNTKAWMDDVSFDVLDDVPSYSTASFERLAAASRLWVYIKYLHPRVTAPGVDWDQSFVDAAPKILDATTDSQFAAAIDGMLAPLHDPYTHVVSEPQDSDDRRVLTVQPRDGTVSVVTVNRGDWNQAIAARSSLEKRLAGAHAVVFDLRGCEVTGLLQTDALALFNNSTGPSMMRRIHFGYTPQGGGVNAGSYHSSWDRPESFRAKVPQRGPAKALFLVNSKTAIPEVALAVQDSGNGAILSEDTLSEDQLPVGTTRGVGKLRVRVRTREVAYRDGSAGVSANAILNQTGDAALLSAVAMARSGNWPPPQPRPRINLPPATLAEKQFADPYPTQSWRMLAAAQIWGVFNYFHPFKPLNGEDWDSVLAEFLPKFAKAKDAPEYHLAVSAMVAHSHDTHAQVSSGPIGDTLGWAPLPVEVRWIEDQPVVTRIVAPVSEKEVRPGDVVTAIDGKPVQQRIDLLSPLFSASTPQSLMRLVMLFLLDGIPGGESVVTFRSPDGSERRITLAFAAENTQKLLHPRTGEVIRLLTPKIGYADLDRLKVDQVDAMFEAFQNTDAIIMDMRGYPLGTTYPIAKRLATAPDRVNAVGRTNIVGDLDEGLITIHETEQRLPRDERQHYAGKTILLIDERAQSAAEHAGLGFRAANGTVFVGSPTSGANGTTPDFVAPGGIRIKFTGTDVRWPDGKQLQRVGIIPDILVRPTIAGIRDGKDEVLERAVRLIQEGR